MSAEQVPASYAVLGDEREVRHPTRDRARSGRFGPGNRLSPGTTAAPFYRTALTKSERVWVASLRHRLTDAGRGTQRWCAARARQALYARRICAWSNGLALDEHAKHADVIGPAVSLLVRVEEEAGGRTPTAKRHPLDLEREAQDDEHAPPA